MSRVAVFVDAGYFWVQCVHVVHGNKQGRGSIHLTYEGLRQALLAHVALEFPATPLLRVYWYDGPGSNGKAPSHVAIDDLDDFKLRLGSRNSAGDQKAVDGLIIADMISLAQRESISDALLISGDADLTPGVIAAQGLGIRVHLLSLGPPAATSPFLRAEVDRKAHWDNNTVRQFAYANSGASTAQSHGSSGGLHLLPARADSETIIAQGITTQLDSTAKEVVGRLVGAQVEQIQNSGKVIPAEFDKLLLRLGAEKIGRALSEVEKRTLRASFKKQVQSERKT